jgi:hypothetical protein
MLVGNLKIESTRYSLRYITLLFNYDSRWLQLCHQMKMIMSSLMIKSRHDNEHLVFYWIILISSKQGRQIISKRIYQSGELIFEEQPLILAQFEWNKLYKYSVYFSLKQKHIYFINYSFFCFLRHVNIVYIH